MKNGKLKKFQIPNWTDVAVDNQGESTWLNGKNTTCELGSQKNLLNRQLCWMSLLPNSWRNLTHHPTKKDGKVLHRSSALKKGGGAVID